MAFDKQVMSAFLRKRQERKKQLKKKKKRIHLRLVRSDEPPSIQQIIDDYAIREAQPYQGWLRPSMLFGCDRANVFHYRLTPMGPQQIDPRLRRILDNGSAIHDMIQNTYLSTHPDWWFVKEPKVEYRLFGIRIWGSCDGVLIRRKDMFRVGVEIKTINHDEFMKLTKPKDEHVLQACIYMHIQRLPWIVILYWDKDKQHLKEFYVSAKDGDWDEVREHVKYLKPWLVEEEQDELASKKKLSLPKYEKRQCQKSFCRYVKDCRRAGAPV